MTISSSFNNWGLFSKGKRGLPGERISERGPSQELVEIFAGMPLVTKQAKPAKLHVASHDYIRRKLEPFHTICFLAIAAQWDFNSGRY